MTNLEIINETLPIDFQDETLDERLMEQELAQIAIGEKDIDMGATKIMPAISFVMGNLERRGIIDDQNPNPVSERTIDE